MTATHANITDTFDTSDMVKVVGTFTKKDGSIRTMTFRCHPTTVVAGLQDQHQKIVWDLEADNFRKFNFGKVVGRVVVV